jgi:hypothetical protein
MSLPVSQKERTAPSMHHMSVDQYDTAFGFVTSPDSLAREIMEKFVLVMYCPETPSNASYGYSISQTMPNQSTKAWRIHSIHTPVVRVIGPLLHRSPSPDKAEWLAIGESNTVDLTFGQINKIVTSISLRLHQGKFNEIDQGLSEADPTKMSPDAVVAISRITYPARMNLGHWKNFVALASVEMNRRGESSDLMVGLI